MKTVTKALLSGLVAVLLASFTVACDKKDDKAATPSAPSASAVAATPTPSASAAPSASQATAATATPKPAEAAKVEAVDDKDDDTPNESEANEKAAKEITAANFKAELDRVEKEIGK